uniref:Uncharacterized protein n=1 Tax=Knipowitschia caucasica TaxID=637954 RepID=A0AAV2MEK0_KNICA
MGNLCLGSIHGEKQEKLSIRGRDVPGPIPDVGTDGKEVASVWLSEQTGPDPSDPGAGVTCGERGPSLSLCDVTCWCWLRVRTVPLCLGEGEVLHGHSRSKCRSPGSSALRLCQVPSLERVV